MAKNQLLCYYLLRRVDVPRGRDYDDVDSEKKSSNAIL
eukprot:CAMPEP_0197828576 /NCGR_PEP_ID=MMETSP1437-20131217/5110_1 /TAXON_ID=49252 ORGANISM="Eucampia antarctica, Strain CCMP1452" /NCGR_SAMPLE_ID=MMETSP1437 /ASSEMBLY_ACC=CAM_ASM_001096 /LENGTH=37 /DNA_ID= /DNA_START= /DNA_END= /DNA_ORIENTATION=